MRIVPFLIVAMDFYESIENKALSDFLIQTSGKESEGFDMLSNFLCKHFYLIFIEKSSSIADKLFYTLFMMV